MSGWIFEVSIVSGELTAFMVSPNSKGRFSSPGMSSMRRSMRGLCLDRRVFAVVVKEGHFSSKTTKSRSAMRMLNARHEG